MPPAPLPARQGRATAIVRLDTAEVATYLADMGDKTITQRRLLLVGSGRTVRSHPPRTHHLAQNLVRFNLTPLLRKPNWDSVALLGYHNADGEANGSRPAPGDGAEHAGRRAIGSSRSCR